MASPKGGSGKTVLTATFGTFLQSLGKKVLIIDTDAATNGLTLLYLKEVLVHADSIIARGKTPRGTYELSAATPSPDVVVLADGMHLLPATYQFINTETNSLEAYRNSLAGTIQMARTSYDFIFLDAQAGSDLFAHAAIHRNVSDEVIIVSEYDPMSAAGVERLKGLFREDLTYGRFWILLNKMLPEFVQSFSDFLEVAKYLNPIPWDSDVVRAYARRKLALDANETNEFTLAVARTLRTLLGDEIKVDIDAWTKERHFAIQRPIEQKYQETMKELDALFGENRRLRLRAFKIKLLLATAIFSPVVLVALHFFTKSGEADLKNPLTSNLWLFILVTGIGFYFFLKDSMRDILAIRNPELERIDRERDLLIERVRKLQALRESDLDVLVKTKN